jgi:PAS domain S-box-containing protein
MKQDLIRKQNEEIKNSILDSLFLVIVIIGLPALIISYLSTKSIGHFPTFSLAGLAILITFVLLKRRVPFLVKGWSLIIIGYLIGTNGVLHEGLLSDGLLYYAFISILASMLINIRSGLIITSISLLTVTLIALLVNQGKHTYSFDIIRYFYSGKTWLGFLLTATMFTFTAVYIYGRLELYLNQYIRDLIHNTNKLNHSKQRLEKEITERRQTELQLSESESKFKRVFDSIGDGIVLLDHHGLIEDVNESFLQITGTPAEVFHQRRLETLFQEPSRICELMQNNASSNMFFSKSENWLKGPDGNRLIPVEVKILPVEQNKRIKEIAIIRDIRFLKENETRIMHAVVKSEEEERKRIAQDLHDGIGPYLSAAKMYVESLTPDQQNTRNQKTHHEIIELLHLSIQSVREIAGNLGTHILKTYGLAAAVQKFVTNLGENLGITFKIDLPVNPALNESVEAALYRILVELINNTLKYAAASEISIQQIEEDNTLYFKYNDNGIGFRLEEVLRQHKGMGLYNIQNRIHSLGGLVDFCTAPGKGVGVSIAFIKSHICKNPSD